MDTSRFDAITRRVANRRAAIRAGGLGLAAAIAPSWRAAAQGSTPVTTPPADPHPSADDATADPEFLFVQPFEHGTWTARTACTR